MPAAAYLNAKSIIVIPKSTIFEAEFIICNNKFITFSAPAATLLLITSLALAQTVPSLPHEEAGIGSLLPLRSRAIVIWLSTLHSSAGA